MLHLEIVWPIYYKNNYESDIYKTDKTHIYNTESFRRPFWYFCDGPARYFGQKLVTTFTFCNCVMENDLCHSLFVYHLGVGDIIEKIIDSRYIGIFTTYR